MAAQIVQVSSGAQNLQSYFLINFLARFKLPVCRSKNRFRSSRTGSLCFLPYVVGKVPGDTEYVLAPARKSTAFKHGGRRRGLRDSLLGSLASSSISSFSGAPS